MSHARFRTPLTLLAALAAAVLLPACTYVNIPPQPGDIAEHDPNDADVRDVTVAAARAALAEWALSSSEGAAGGPVRIVLPRGTQPIAYDQTLPRISPRAVGPEAPVESAPTLTIQAIRIRGSRAEVDILRPLAPGADEGPQQLVTARLSDEPLTGWHVDELRAWRTGVDQALRRGPAAPPDDRLR